MPRRLTGDVAGIYWNEGRRDVNFKGGDIYRKSNSRLREFQDILNNFLLYISKKKMLKRKNL